MSTSSVVFNIPDNLNAVAPPERRGVRRDHVRLMVLNRNMGETAHDIFYHLGKYLRKGDLLIFNNSRTIPAILHGRSVKTGTRMEVRISRQVKEHVWEVLLVTDENENMAGDQIVFADDLYLTIRSPKNGLPFYVVEFSAQGLEFWNALYRWGEPVRYEYIRQPWPLSDYQTVYGSVPGSVEMASAGRAFSWEMMFELKQKGIQLGFLQLHTGLSYLLDDKWHIGPAENMEYYHIPKETVELIEKTKKTGGRIIAVGTTVVRALETVALKGEWKHPSGWTNLHIDKNLDLKVADGLITGFHEPEASHLDLLTAFVPEKMLETAYQEAIKEGYLWHEFGDINLIL
ncbi:MAG: S-adenosylmethionine:tRNA ribosyltransferase-isomerase [Tuberibacillus sp.]